MNERIKELAIQAIGSNPTYAVAMIMASPEVKKFAELIVDECINVIQKDLDENPEEHDAFQQAMYHATLLLKEKFGVK